MTITIGALAQAGIAYPTFAPAMRWPIGAFPSTDGWLLYCGAACLCSASVAFQTGGWTGLLVFVPGILIGAFALTMTLRSWVQVAAAASLPLAVIWYALALFGVCNESGCG